MLTTLLGLALAASGTPQVSPEETRSVVMELRDGDRLIANPVLNVRLGTTAALSTAGADGYGLSLALERAGDDYLVRSAFYRPRPAGWRLVAQPALQLAPGAVARVSFNDADGRPLSISFRVR